MRCTRVVLLIMVALGGSVPLSGATQMSPMDRLAESIDETSVRLVPLTDEQIQLARTRVMEAADQLQQFLSRGSSANAEAWKTYLQWDQLQDQLTGPARPDPDQVGRVAARYFTGQPGLDLTPFVEVREALLGYRRLLMAQADADLQQRLSEQLQALREILQGASDRPTAAAAEIAARLEWLEQLGQAPELVERIRGCYGHPNLLASVSSEMIATRFDDNVARTSPVRETILGTPIRGLAYTAGKLSARLIPSDETALIEIVMNGTTTSNTVGYHPPVTIHSDGITQVLARKRLLIDDLGVRAEPACASCSTSTQIKCIGTAKRLGSQMIQRVAWKRAHAQKPQAECISARLAEVRVAQQMDQQALEVIASSNGRLESKVRRPLRAKSLPALAATSDHGAASVPERPARSTCAAGRSQHASCQPGDGCHRAGA